MITQKTTDAERQKACKPSNIKTSSDLQGIEREQNIMSKYKKLVESIRKSCKSTIECNERIMEEHFKGYDGRYYDHQREEYTMLYIEIEQAEAILRQINDTLKPRKAVK